MRQVLFFVFCSGFFRGIKSQPLLLAQPPAGGALSWSSNVTGFHSGWLALLLFLYKEEEAASKIPCCGGILQELDSQLSFSHKKHQKQSKTFTVTPEYLFKSSNKCCVMHRQHFQVLTSLFFWDALCGIVTARTCGINSHSRTRRAFHLARQVS